MKKFNLLLIGDANHQYNINFSKWLKKVSPNISISIISTNPNQKINIENNPYDRIYILLNNLNFISKIKGIRTLYRAFNTYRIIIINKLGADAILIQYLVPWLSLITFFIKRKTKNFIVVPWGSDFLREKNSNKVKRYIKNAHNILIGSPQFLDLFKNNYVIYKEKFHLCFFGNEPIEELKNFKESFVMREHSCKFFQFSEEKINVTIGHNGSKAHQHINILNELLRLTPEILKKIRVILPMTYGLTQEYLEEVKMTIKKTMVECIIISDFMTENETAHLRNLTDIMVNLQTTDGFSGSMREVLYCGGIVINGSWLPYQFLKKMGVYYEEVNSIKELPDILNKIISEFNYYKGKCKENPSKIYNISSWSEVITKWKEVIEIQK